MHTAMSVEMTFWWGAVLVFLSMFLFWRSVRRSFLFAGDGRSAEEIDADSERWGLSSFDLMILSFLGALFVSRLAYIVVNPDVFREARWFYLPYEKIDGEVNFFASLPWLFFRFWDFLPTVESLVLGWLLFLVWLSRFMRIPWRYLANAVADVFWIVFVGIEVYLGIREVSIIPFVIIVYLAVLAFFRFLTNRERIRSGATVFYKTIAILWKLSTITGLPIALSIVLLFSKDYQGKVFSLAVSALAVLAGLWIIARELFEYVAIIRYGAAAVLNPAPSHNEGFRSDVFTKSSPSWRRYLSENPERKTIFGPAIPRDFSKSYKDYVTVWQRLWMKTAGKLFGSRKGSDEYDRPPSEGAGE